MVHVTVVSFFSSLWILLKLYLFIFLLHLVTQKLLNWYRLNCERIHDSVLICLFLWWFSILLIISGNVHTNPGPGSSPRKNATYLSPYSHNEMIEVIGTKIIKSDIIDEIKQAKFHTVSLDEVTSSNEQLMSICFCYVDKNHNIIEAFLEFVSLERITGEHIGTTLLEFYKRTGINIKQCVAQCYDGASNMQSERVGAASYVLKESPQAVVTHCCMHNLNLTLASSCNFLLAQNILEQYKNITLFFNYSPKRENLLIFLYKKLP